ncbi:MAG TPA: hypothetical protein VGF48_26070 [Thermoanaerobaculia bacterium]|jgi:hypothetical protein
MKNLVALVVLCLAFALPALAVCPAGPGIIAPTGSNVAVVEGTVTLKWSPVSGAASYDVYFGPAGACTGAPVATVNGTSFQPPDEDVAPASSYQWRVVANSVPGCTTPPTSSCASFSTRPCPTAAPTLIAPANNSSIASGSVTLQWSSVTNASFYEVFVGLDGAEPSSHAFTNITSKTFAIGPGIDVEWYIVAHGSDCVNGQASSSFRFSTNESACPTGAAALTSPASGANFTEGTPVLFSWSEVPNALSYDLAINDGGGWRVLTSTTRTRTTENLPPGTYEWEVHTNFAGGCNPTGSDHRTLSVTANSCSTTPPLLLAPANGASNVASPVQFQWREVAGAARYHLFVSVDGGPVALLATTTGTTHQATLNGSSVLWAVAAAFDNNCSDVRSEPARFNLAGAACSTTGPQLLEPANNATDVASPVKLKWAPVTGAQRYIVLAAIDDNEFTAIGTTEETQLETFVPANVLVRWLVVAAAPNCPEVRSATGQFRTAGPECTSASLALQSPADGAQVSSPVALSWSAVPNAAAYRVWISIDGDAPVNVIRTAATSATVNLPSGTMRWYVEALRGQCDPVLSETRTFVVGAGADCTTRQAPTLAGPIGAPGSPVNVTNPVDLRWNAVSGAIGYRVFIAEGTDAFEDLGITRETHVARAFEPGTYRWLVEALYENCPPVASAQGHFRLERTTPRCSTTAPTILTPADNTAATSPVTINWTAVEGAEKYRVYASLDGGEPIHIGTTEETTLTRALAPGSIEIAVEAVFNDCPSTFSARSRFTIARAQNCSTAKPQLLGPANGSTAAPGNVAFAWQPLAGAVRYVVVVQAGEGARTPVGETDLPSLDRKLPAGRYTWSVIAFFPGCDPVESDRLTFTLTSPDACDTNRAPILFSPTERDGLVAAPVHFEWSSVARAKGYQVWGAKGGSEPSIIATTRATEADVNLPAGNYRWFVEALFENCPPVESAHAAFRVTGQPIDCVSPVKPEAQVVGQALSGTPYKVRWTKLPQVALYEVQESTTLDFANATTRTVEAASATFVHEVTASTQFLYRVRGISNCNDERGPYSDVVGVFVIPPQSRNGSAEVGTEGNVVQTIFLPGADTPLQFIATVDKPWLTVTPSSGTLPTTGITLTVTADPTVLALGTNTGTVKVAYSGAGKTTSHANTVSTVPISISIVTPVTPAGKGTPPPDALIIPAVAHAEGANESFFESDIRVTNLSAQTMKYSVNFTPSGTDGTQKGSSSTIEIAPNQTLALDDILATLFGSGSTSVIGMLEIRPTSSQTSSSTSSGTKVSQLSTIASSRTYNLTPNGTFGQYIPALPYSSFVGKSTTSTPTILSLQQIAQSASFRTNFGFAEASGQPATLSMRVYDTANRLLATIPVSLQAGEHKQINAMLAANGINDLADGRVEIEVTSSTGKVTAYASTVDNRTNDPLMVWPVVKGATTSNRFTLPGMATINTGTALWRSDVRIFNAGAATAATLTYYPQGNPGAPISKEITLDAGEVEVIDDILGGLFAQPNGAGGSLVVTTPNNAPIVASARTYNQTTSGTYGQFIPGVTAAQSIGTGDRALQILQLEQSSRIRTNIGFAETTGQPVTIEVSLTQPDTKSTPILTYNLAAHEFRQVPLSAFPIGDALYNARVSVKVVGGAGKVTAYGSAIDMITQDPTYVPAQ